MTPSQTPRNPLQAPIQVVQKVIHFIAHGVLRLFSPSSDDYPATGVQPFTGDPPEES